MIMFPAAIVMMDDEDNRSFMEQLYIQHRYLLFKVAYDTVGDPQIAEDMVSEACMLFIENIEILRKLNIAGKRMAVSALSAPEHAGGRRAGCSFLRGCALYDSSHLDLFSV